MRLFERGRIGTLETRNCIAMAPMGTNGLTDIDFGYSRRLIDCVDKPSLFVFNQ